jgi:hypothetical protein
MTNKPCEKIQHRKKIMRVQKRAAVLLFLFACTHHKTEKTKSTASLPEGEVRGRSQSTSSYCGGIPPPPELVKELGTPKAEVGLTLLFREGELNDPKSRIFSEVTTDAEGRFSVTLPVGTYCIVEDAKRKKGPLPTAGDLVANEQCYNTWLSTCDAVLHLGAEHGEAIEIIHDRGCGDPVCVDMPKRP